MITTIASMVHPLTCEPPYLMEAFKKINHKIDNSYNFIIARTNSNEEKEHFEKCIQPDKKNVLFLLSDEFGIVPPFLDRLHLVFRTYSRRDLCDNKKIFPIPCGYSCGYVSFAAKNDWVYIEQNKKPLIERPYDIFYSGQKSPNRISFIDSLNRVKDKFKSVVNITDGFAKGYELDEYYNLMHNSKIAVVPNGAVVPESFRYFEAFESNCIVITTYPRWSYDFNLWFYDNSPAVFIHDWRELTEDLIRSLLTEQSLKEYEVKNKEYFDKSISPKGISEYILKIIKEKEN